MDSQKHLNGPTSRQPTAFVVLKFGGTSVATAERWRRIARLVEQSIAEGHHPVLVCSALSGVTNSLEALITAIEVGQRPTEVLCSIWEKHLRLAEELGLNARDAVGETFSELAELAQSAELGRLASPRWRAQVMSKGELMSTRLGAAWLRRAGFGVRWLDARSVLRQAPSRYEDAAGASPESYLSACCDATPRHEVQQQLLAGASVTITQGFIAKNDAGETVLLGRGGSDTSAAYLASVLDAERLEIWTDVPGLFTTDPRHNPGARLLPRVTYEQAAVLGGLGAKVLHPRCLPAVERRGIPLVIRWTDQPEEKGTVIGSGPEYTSTGIQAIASRSKLCLIRMRRDRCWQPVGFMSEVASCFQRHGLSMDLVSSSPAEIRATIDLGANPGALARLPALMDELRRCCEPSLVEEVACVSVVGSHISEEMPRIASVMRLFESLDVHLVSHAADDTHVSYVIDAPSAQDLVQAVHATIFDDAAAPSGVTWHELLTAVSRKSQRFSGTPIPVAVQEASA